MLVNVYLDDYRPCPQGFILAKNVEECLTLLETYEVKVLSLDYDLGWNQRTGIQLAWSMVDRGLYARHIYLHSSSPLGRKQMYDALAPHIPADVTLHSGAMSQELLDDIGNNHGRGEAL